MSVLPQLTQYQARINQFIGARLEELPAIAPRLKQAMQYALLIGGKRMRPYLCYISGETLNLPIEQCDVIASAVECIHAYSLIHDDLPAMDDDSLRRGQPTCHVKFDEATAILAGDSLQTMAFELLVDYPMTNISASQRVKLVSLLAKASGYRGMCGGQAIDLQATNQAQSLEQLTQMHQLKTGALLNVCIAMLCELKAELAEEHKQALIRFAQCVGLAYQIRDDIIDITSDESTLGKPVGSDQANNKSTYPALMGLTAAQQKADLLYNEALHALSSLPYNTQNLSNFAQFVVCRDS